MYHMMRRRDDWDVALVTLRNDYEDIAAHEVRDIADVFSAPGYMNADVLFYSFGIYNDLFDCMTVGNGKALQIARFHNITPAHLLPPGAAALIEKSFAQVNNLRNCDWIWADSRYNADVLRDLDFDERKIEVVPLVVEQPVLASLSTKSAEPLHILFVGRAVKSKGLLDGLEAIAQFARSGIPFKLTIAGNLNFSEAAYLASCKALVESRGLQATVDMLGTVDDDRLGQLYARSHLLLIPSYHEGFCVPVVEALRAGCVPIGYSAGNLPHIVNGLGRLVALGDIEALGAAISEVAGSIHAARNDLSSVRLPLDRGHLGVNEFTGLAAEHVTSFTLERVAMQTMARLDNLVPVKN
jgi:glycosyltransferase involved in cell wall biosynthesis